MSKPRAPAKRQPTWLAGHGNLSMSLVLIAPLLLIYELGVMFTDHMNGADLVTRVMLVLCGGNIATYLAVHFGLAVAFAAWLWHRRKHHPFQLRVVALLALEAAIYAASMAVLINMAIRGLGLAIGEGLERLILAIGAGVHEELVFRFLLMGGIATIMTRLGYNRAASVGIALLTSAIIFSGAHHLGAMGSPFTLQAFLFRFAAGVCLGAIFWWRSLAHAVYTHAFYDILVMVLI